MHNLSDIQVNNGSSWVKICPFPVGYIYLSSNDTSPASIFGGNWLALTDSKFLLPQGKWNSIGGAGSKTLAVKNLPNHTHYLYGWPNKGSYAGSGVLPIQDTYWGSISYNPNMGQREPIETGLNLNGEAFSIWNPYRSCFAWYRTA